MSITHSSVVPVPPGEVFAWHDRPGALRRLIPPWQPISVVTETGSLIDGQAVLRLPGGLRWVAQHSGVEPPVQFVDDLVSLPLRWHHVHRFELEGEDATRVTDVVDTPVPRRALQRTFVYRHRQLADDMVSQRSLRAFGTDAATDAATVAVTGSSGLVGAALCAFLTTAGHRVVRLVRGPPIRADERRWDPSAPEPEMLRGVDAVVHLAGASIAGRFTRAHKEAIAESRIGPTRRLAEAAASLPGGPRVLVCASAIGFYGANRGDEPLTESSLAGDDFLAQVVAAWENAAKGGGPGTRVVQVRTGIVMSPRGGVLRLLRPLYWAGAGGRLGDGRQWFSWIDLDDLTDIYARALFDSAVEGPINAVAPHPVQGAEFTTTLGRVLRRPAVIPVPDLAPRLLLGQEGAHAVALASQRVVPERVVSFDQPFRRPALEACLRHQLGRFAS